MLQNTLRKSYNRNAKSTLVVLAVQMFLLCCSDVFGCYVRNVQLFAGPNSTDAHNKVYAGEVLYSPIGKTVYFCGRCEHGWNPPHDDLIYEWDFDDGVTDTDPYDWDDYDEHESHIYSDADEYHPKLTICVEDGMCGSDVCDVTVVEVQKVVKNESPYDDEGPIYIGLDSTVSLRAYPYPSGHFPDDEPHWSIVSQPSGASASITGDEDPVTATLDNLTKAGNYVIKAKCGSVDTGDNITVTAVKVDLDIYNEHGGSVLDDDDETSPGSFVLINKDDDDGANGQDNSNDVIDGPSDKQDMAKIKLDVEPSVATALTVQLNADYPLRVKVFDDGDTKVASWPHTIPISQFSSGAIYYHVEGISAGAVNFTLTVKLGTSTINSDQVKVTVKDYVNWKAWPGAQTSTSLNPTETFSSSDLGLSGQVDWILTHGGTSGATIEDSVPSGGSGTSASDKSQITVRYGTQSSSASFTNAVEVKAYDTGADSKLGACRRTIFKSSWQSPNFSNTLDSDNDLRFPDKLGSNTNKAEFNWDNERNATRIAAKMETVLNFLPSDIDWSARGVSFVFTSGSSGYTFQGREMRDFRRAFGEQLTYDPSRSHLYSDWDIDGTAQTGDTQYPSATVTNKSFTIDAPGFDADVREQGYYRNDLRDYYQWHNGSSWTRITAYCQWYVNITGALPDCSETSPSDDGTGTTSEDVPNAKPVADAGDDDSIDSGTTGYLMGGYTDADNDICTYKWQQISGPSVTISDDTAQNPTFTAPTVGSPTVLTFQLKVKDGTQDLGCYSSGNSESAADTVDITVNP